MNDYKMSVMKNFNFLFSVAIALVTSCLIACRDGASSSSDHPTLGADDSLCVIQEPGFKMNVILPKTLLADEPQKIVYNQNLGHLEVSIGDKFDFQLIDDSIDVDVIKSELQNDQFMSFTFHDVGAGQYDYEAVLPDGNVMSYHYMGLHNIGGSTYFIRTNPESEFTQMQVTRMKKAINSLYTN